MPSKRISGTFFDFSQQQQGALDQLFQNLKEKLDANGDDKLVNVKVADCYFRVVELRKENYGHIGREVWNGIIEKLDINELSITSDILGNRQVHGDGEKEGPVTHTGFVYDPLTSIILLHKRIGGINYERLGVFLRRILKDTGVVQDSKGYQLAILVDPDKIERLRRAPTIKEMTFSYKPPSNMASLRNGDRSIIGDFMLADNYNGEHIRIEIKGEHLDKSKVVRKMNQLLDLFGKDMGTARVVTEHNDTEEVLDLLSDRLSDYVDVNLTRGQKITEVVIIDSIKKIFENNIGVLDQHYRAGDQE